MEKEKEYLLWFEQMERKDVAIVGGKSSSLGEMTAKTDVPVPYGYATTAYAYRYFIEATGLKEKMAALIGQITDVENTAQLRDISAKLRKAIMDERTVQRDCGRSARRQFCRPAGYLPECAGRQDDHPEG